MQIAVAMAGFSMGEADTLRKAMGKKKIEYLMPFKERFVKGAAERGYEERSRGGHVRDVRPVRGLRLQRVPRVRLRPGRLPDRVPDGASPVSYMAAILTSVKDDKDRKPYYLYACRAMGIEVLPPDVNDSAHDFAPATGGGRAIRTGSPPSATSARRRCTRSSRRAPRRAVRVVHRLLPEGRSVRPHEAGPRVADPRGGVRLARVRAPRAARRPGQGLRADRVGAEGRGGRAVLPVRRRPGRGPDRRVGPRGRGVREAGAPPLREGDARTVRDGPSAAVGRRRPARPEHPRDRGPRGGGRRRARDDRRDHRRGVPKYTKRGEPYAQFRLDGLAAGVEVVAFPSVYEADPSDRRRPDRPGGRRIDRRGRELQIRANEVREPALARDGVGERAERGSPS